MKKAFLLLISAASLLLTACVNRGNVDSVEIPDWKPSEIYADTEIEAAFLVVKDYFSREFDGCTLTRLYYPGDSFADEFREWAEDYDADEAIVLRSCFDAGPMGGDGSLNPNSTYEDWEWVLIRSGGGDWEFATGGYC